MKGRLDIIDSISTGVGKFAGFLILALVFTVLFEVVARYAFNAPQFWSFHMTRWLWGASAILGGVWTMQRRRHIAIDVVPQRLSPRARTILSLVTYTLFFFPLMVAYLWGVTDQAMWSWSHMEVDRGAEAIWVVPIYPIKTLIPIAVFLLLLQGIANCIRDLRFVIKGR